MHIVSNIRRLTYLFVILFVVMSGVLVYWQVAVEAQVVQNPHNIRACLNTPQRGRILDRNGIVLAESVRSSSCGYMRHYTDPSLAGLIGYYISPSYPSTGIEHQFDAYLNGQYNLMPTDRLIHSVLHRPLVGDDIYLTIDERIQQLVNHHYDDPITIDNKITFPTDRGSVVVSNPHTGEVLAMLSRPGFDPNKLVSTIIRGDLSYFKILDSDPERPLLERPIQNTYIPGSTYKAVTLMAGLDSGNTTLQTPFAKQNALGPIFYNGQQIGPVGNNIGSYTKNFPVTTEYGFTHSDNIIFAQIGVKTGADTWLDYNKRFYIGEHIPFDLPVVVSTVQKNGQPLADNELAADAYGQGYNAISPFQMSLFDNAVANNGVLMQPLLVKKILDTQQSAVLLNNARVLATPIKEQTAIDTRQAMFGVVRCGSGSIIQQLFTSQAGIIGKTGSAQVSDDLSIPAHGWLITQAPYTVTQPNQLPALTIVAMKENSGEGGKAVGPLIASIYNDVFSKHYVDAQLPAAPDSAYCCSTHLLQIGCAPAPHKK